MAQMYTSEATAKTTSTKQNYLIPFILVTSLFFLWGFAISMLDVLNKHFQEVLNISKAQSAWVQVCTFGAYFVMALPAGYFMKRWGYKRGILAGLLLYAGGAFLVYPAGEAQSWTFFLIALFILACGLAFLETAANPYATVLGPKESSAQRLNLAQSFNGLGVITGPLVGGLLVFAAAESTVEAGFDSVQLPYMIVGGVVLLVAVFFFFTPMPEIESHESDFVGAATPTKPLFQNKHFVFAALAQFLNVGAQGCVWGFFINYATEVLSISNQNASFLLSASMVIFMVGRFASTFIMRFIEPNKLLGIYGLSMVGLLLIVTFHLLGQASIYALMAFFFFQSITFPTIFALGLKDLGKYTKQASSYIIMGIVGGAVFPPIMGAIADNSSTAFSFILPTLMFIMIAWYGFKGSQLR
ncbi:MAG: L-fucose:H+ symporter permease [Saprospiraceae bacterium]